VKNQTLNCFIVALQNCLGFFVIFAVYNLLHHFLISHSSPLNFPNFISLSLICTHLTPFFPNHKTLTPNSHYSPNPNLHSLVTLQLVSKSSFPLYYQSTHQVLKKKTTITYSWENLFILIILHHTVENMETDSAYERDEETVSDSSQEIHVPRKPHKWGKHIREEPTTLTELLASSLAVTCFKNQSCY